jgi:hypothetical protein
MGPDHPPNKAVQVFIQTILGRQLLSGFLQDSVQKAGSSCGFGPAVILIPRLGWAWFLGLGLPSQKAFPGPPERVKGGQPAIELVGMEILQGGEGDFLLLAPPDSSSQPHPRRQTSELQDVLWRDPDEGPFMEVRGR